MSARKPYGVGVNGHANCCDCTSCADWRADFIMERARGSNLGGHLHNTRTVFVPSYVVRSHFRRGKDHLAKFPNTRSAVHCAINKALIGKGK